MRTATPTRTARTSITNGLQYWHTLRRPTLMRTKVAIVTALEAACAITHYRPISRYAWCFMADWSEALDRRWGTGVWGKP